MADLTVVTMQQCQKGYGNHVIDGHHVYINIDGHMECDCADYKYRRKPHGQACKHILQAYEGCCGWHEQFGNPQSPFEAAHQVCPKCSSKTEYVRVGV